MMIYGLMAVWGFIALVWRIRIMEVLIISSAPIGAAFTMIALITGSLWGRPTWGTYWVWDARLTSELVLLFLYFGVIALYNSFDEPRKAARAASLLSIVGAVNLPVIYFTQLMGLAYGLEPGVVAAEAQAQTPAEYDRGQLKLLWSLLADDVSLTCVGLTYGGQRIEWPRAHSRPEPMATWSLFTVDTQADVALTVEASQTVFLETGNHPILEP